MGLNWDATACSDTEDLVAKEMWPVTESLIVSSMIIQLGEVTTKNIPEWRFRFAAWAQASLPLLKFEGDYSDMGDRGVPYVETMERYVGLRLNVSPATRKQFMNHLRNCIERDAESLLDNIDKDALLLKGGE